MQPKEHGSWAVFAVPLTAGLVGSGFQWTPAALFVVGALTAFLARAPLLALVRAPGDRKAREALAALSLAAAAAFAALFAIYGRWLLLAFGAAGAGLLLADLRAQKTRRGMSFGNELLGVAGLCLGAPAAAYATHGTLDAPAWILWAVCAAYFVGPIFFVKMAALQHRAASNDSLQEELAGARGRALLYHEAAFFAVVAAAIAGRVPAFTPAPFALALLKTAARARKGPARVSFKSLGYQEVALSAFFLICLL